MKTDRRGFTLIELMIVVAVITIIASLAIPNLLRHRMSANEACAAGSMRIIATAQVGFQTAALYDAAGDGVGDFGTLAQLAEPPGNPDQPAFIDAVLGQGMRSGYRFSVVVTEGIGDTAPAYTCNGDPVEVHRTGTRRFFVDETGVIRFTANGSPATVDSVPMQ